MSIVKATLIFVVAFAAVTAHAGETGTVEVIKLGDRTSCPVRPWNPSQTAIREKTVHVTFKKPYSAKPMVSAAISAQDIDSKYNARILTRVENITTEGFDLTIGVWCNTYAYWVEASYVVVPNIYA